MKENDAEKNGTIWTKTPSGMDCYLFSMPEYEEKMAAIVVKAGSNFLSCQGKDGMLQFPDGTAHFIEHRLFRQKWGDAFSAFSKQGASANAFTDGEKTVYYFSCQENFFENLRLLLSFVQNPYFLPEETEQEKNIIQSEITMYDDDPDWRVYYQLLQAMYHTHPVRIPIAGDAKSLKKIDETVLKQAYDCMYSPNRFSLICAGDLRLRKIVETAGMVKSKAALQKPVFEQEPAQVKESYAEGRLGISRPIFQIGFKLVPNTQNPLRRRLLMSMILDIWAGESSAFYQEAYGKRYLDEPLGNAYFNGEGYEFCAFSGVGEKGKEVSELLWQHMARLIKEGITEKDFVRIRKKQIGRFIRRGQSVSGTVLGQIEWAMADCAAGQVFHYIKTVQRAEGEKILRKEFSKEKMVLSVVR